jgi:uncharacterized protein (DUF305 family)
MKKLVTSLVLAGSLVFVLSGCATGTLDLPNSGGESYESAPQFAQAFDANDVMFAQMMIVHHQQALDLCALAVENTNNPDVLALARDIRDAQEPEIATMRSWLEAADADENHMHNMAMPGLADQETMNEITETIDGAFDSLFLMTMIQHHEGAIVMANSVLETSVNDDVIALAKTVIETQTAEIDAMYALLGP